MCGVRRQYVIGIDEAGYGPNIGPLVIAGTVWSLPAGQTADELWPALSDCVTNQPGINDQRLHVADSKKVYQSQQGIKQLEQSVLSLYLCGLSKTDIQSAELRSNSGGLNFAEYLRTVQERIPDTFGAQLWYSPTRFTLPVAASWVELDRHRQLLQEAFTQHDVQLERIGIEVICPERFNRECEQWGNKSSLLSHNSFQLIQRLWPDNESQVLVLCDKHGGRNRYQEFLQCYFPDLFLMQERESRAESRYRLGGIEFRFATRSETHLPVAWASLFAKYTREICLEQFNHFWTTRQPGLKPTKGYPQDAKRFRAEIEPHLQAHPEWLPLLWRNR